jgi:hypothetical protein
MDGRRRGSYWSEGPKVRVRRKVTIRSEGARPDKGTRVATEPLRGTLRALEHRFLSLQDLSAAGHWSEAVEGCATLLADLRVISSRLEEEVGRCDLTFLDDRRLSLLQDRTVWLTRRVSSAMLLAQQLLLERELKRLVEPRGYQVYLCLEDLSEVAHEVEALSGQDLMVKLRDGTLLAGFLDLLSSQLRSEPQECE